jgi:hypothetical protein
MKYMQPPLDSIERGDIDPSFVITHRLPLDDAPQAYKMFRDKQDPLHRGGAQAAWGGHGALTMRIADCGLRIDCRLRIADWGLNRRLSACA